MESRKKILIVEDNLLLSMIEKRLIEEMGNDVIACVDNAQDAIIAARNQHPDLIFMDIQLKGEADGVEAMKEIRQHFDIPVVYISGSSSGALYEKAKKNGCADYLVKPVDKNELDETFRKVFATVPVRKSPLHASKNG